MNLEEDKLGDEEKEILRFFNSKKEAIPFNDLDPNKINSMLYLSSMGLMNRFNKMKAKEVKQFYEITEKGRYYINNYI